MLLPGEVSSDAWLVGRTPLPTWTKGRITVADNIDRFLPTSKEKNNFKERIKNYSD